MKKVLVLLLLVLVLVGCSNNEQTTDVEDVKNDIEVNKSNEVTTSDNEDVQDVRESEIGKLIVFKKNENVNTIKESGPFTVKVNKMQVARLEVSENYKGMFDNKDVVTIVTLEVEVENNSTDTNSIYPDQGTIVTNTKEQKDAHLFLSGDVGGDFIGEVIKKDNVIFVLNSEAEEITNFKYIISGPVNANWDSIGEELTFELSFE